MIMNDVDNYYLKLHIATQLYMKSSCLLCTHILMLKKSKSQCFISCVCITRFFIVWTNTQKVYEIANYEECVCSLVVVARGHCPSSLWQTECHCLEYCSCCGGWEKQHMHTSHTTMKRFDRGKKCYEPICIINTCIAWKPLRFKPLKCAMAPLYSGHF